MSTLLSQDLPYISPLQCYVCQNNTACKLSTADAVKPTSEQIPGISMPSVPCRGCKLQCYCSLRHRVEYYGHRSFCLVLIDLQKALNIEHPLLLNGKISRRSELQDAIAQLMMAVRVKLKRKLTCRERELIGYPAYCVVCYSLETLTACNRCAAVAYCSTDHRWLDRVNHTQEVCNTLALCYLPYRMLENKFEVRQFQHRSDLERSDLVEAFHLATGIEVDNKPWRSLEDYEHFATCSSFSAIGSICLALTHISFLAAPHEIVSVYVLGASEKHRRYFQEMHLKFYFLQYESVYQLDIYFIGCKLQSGAGEEELTIEFQDRKRKVVRRSFLMTFERFVKMHKVNPALIIIYNPDFASMDNITERVVEHRYPHAVQPLELNDYDWSSCLLEILSTYGVPICFTSPTKMQSRSDITCVNVLARTQKISVECAYNCRENPYREILPHHNPCPNDNETVIYDNNYLEVIFTSKKS